MESIFAIIGRFLSLKKETLMRHKKRQIDSFLRDCELQIRLVTLLIFCVVVLWLILVVFLSLSFYFGLLPAHFLWLILFFFTLLFSGLFSMLLRIRHGLKRDF